MHMLSRCVLLLDKEFHLQVGLQYLAFLQVLHLQIHRSGLHPLFHHPPLTCQGFLAHNLVCLLQRPALNRGQSSVII